jgi:hypothetical protein
MIQVAIEKYKKVQGLNWNEAEKLSGKRIKIKGFPRDKKVNFFGNGVSANFSRIYCH